MSLLPTRVAFENQLLRETFPDFMSGESFRHVFGYPSLGVISTWVGYLQPFAYDAPVALIAAHLARQVSLEVRPNGNLIPTDTSLTPHAALEQQNVPPTTFKVEVICTDEHQIPHVVIRQPAINRRTYPKHPHLSGVRNARGQLGQVTACVFPPHDNDWDWETSHLPTFVSWTAQWLANHLIWLELGTWVGQEAPHQLADLVQIPSKHSCHCGSGKSYGECHKRHDLTLFKRKRRAA